MNTKTIGGVLAFALASFCCLLVSSCAVLAAIFTGATTGAVVTKTPQGALAGGAAGLVVGSWDYIVATVRGWFGAGLAVPPPAPFNPIVLWGIVALLFYAAYKFLSDHQFRSHVGNGIVKFVNPKPQGKPNEPS